MEIRAGYKNTEVGVIPEDWEVKTLGEVGEVKMCKRIFSHQTKENGDIPFYKIGTFGKEPDAFISKEIYAEFRRKYSFPTKGSVLISAAGTIGRIIVYNGDDAYFQDSNIVWIDNNNQVISNEYLKHSFPIVKFRTEGGTIQRLYNNILKSGLFPSPPTKFEQTAIASALSDADALINSLEKLIAKKRNIKQGAMQKLLKPKEEWEVKKFSEIFIKHPTKKYQLNSNEYEVSGLYPIIDQGKKMIVGYSDNYEKLFKCPSNGVIVFGDHTRILKFVDFNFIVGADGTQLLSVQDEYSMLFVYYLLLTKEIPNTGYNRHFKFLLELEFSIPSTKEEQTRIATILSDMDAEIQALEIKLEKYRKIKLGMMQELLTGKIRLV